MAHCCGKNNHRYFNNCPLKILVHLGIIITSSFSWWRNRNTIFCSPRWWNNEWIHFWNIFFIHTHKQLPKAILLVESTICEERKTTRFLLHVILPCGCCCHFTMRHPSSSPMHADLGKQIRIWMSSLWNWLLIRQWTQSMNAAVNQQMLGRLNVSPKRLRFN